MCTARMCYCLRMIAHLRGMIGKGQPGEVSVDIHGVGYRVTVPVNAWDELHEGQEAQLWISTYVREDRLELFGFTDRETRLLFEQCISMSGVGPKMGVELCAVPRGILMKAVQDNDPAVLQNVKGVGRKTAEKLLLELKSLVDREPALFAGSADHPLAASFDQDTIEALVQLGYSTQDILQVLKGLPKNLATTEERVTAALRNL